MSALAEVLAAVIDAAKGFAAAFAAEAFELITFGAFSDDDDLPPTAGAVVV